MNGKVTYRQQYTRCGKERCRKCKEGEGHGPYWYAYWSENGRTISKYIGIHAPVEVVTQQVFSVPMEESAKAQRSLIHSSLRAPASLTSLDGPVEAAPASLRVAEESTVTAVPRSAEELSEKEVNLAREQSGSLAEIAKPLEEKVPPARRKYFSETPGVQPLLRMYLLGQFDAERRVGKEWQPIAPRTWQRRRARALLGCLLSQAGRRMGREQVMEALWPELDIETASNRLNGAVHELRQILEPGIARPSSSSMLRLERDILMLADSSIIWVDADAFELLLNRANSTTDPVLLETTLEQAATLYDGDYLPEELYSQWAAVRREALRRSWMGLLLELARLRAARSAFISAIEPRERLLTADPTHETAVRRLMILLTHLDRRGEAIRVYQRLATTLKEEYEGEPLVETVQLYEELCRGYAQKAAQSSQQAQSEREQLSGQQAPGQPVRADVQDQVAALLASQRLGRHNQSPLIGRENELATMRQVLLAIDSISPQAAADARKRIGAPERGAKLVHFAMMMGETGIGKTRLAEEISHEAQARGWLVIWTRAYEQEGTIPYRPWTDILRALLRDLPLEEIRRMLEEKTEPGESAGALNHAATAQAKLARLSALLPELATHQELSLAQHRPATPEQERLYLWEAVLALLNAFSQSTPLLIVLDDLHWTDDSSLELLAYLARHQPNERIMWIGTCQEVELTPSASLRSLLNDLRREQVLVTLPLHPLTSAQIARLLAHIPRGLLPSIQSQAGGNPLFAEELARFSEVAPLEKRGETGQSESYSPPHEVRSAARGSSLPETIAAVLERRLNTLNGDCQALLSKAAVLGGSFELRMLLRMTGEAGPGEDNTLDLLEAALRSGLLTEEVSGGRIVYHFWHPLIVSHLYERLSAARRAQLHCKAAAALIELHADNEAEVAAAIAHHLSKYGQERQQLVYYAETAANQARALSAYPEALHYYCQALEALQSLRNIQQSPLHRANLLECVAECNDVQGNYQEARQQYIQVLDLHSAYQIDANAFDTLEEYQAWQREEAQVQAMLWREIGRCWRSVSEYRQAHECAEKGRQVLRAKQITSGAAWACLQHLDGVTYWSEGNFDEATRSIQECLEIYQEVMRQSQTQVQVHSVYANAPLLTRSRLVLLGDPLELGWTHESLGVVVASSGRYAASLAHLHTALAIFEEHDLVRGMSQVCSNIGAVNSMQCEYTIAAPYFQRALELAERIGHVSSKMLATGNLGDVAAHAGNLRAAQSWITDSLAMSEQVLDREQSSWCLISLAAVHLDLGEMRESLEYIRRALIVVHSMKSSMRLGYALATLAEWRVTRALYYRSLEMEHLDNPANMPDASLSLLRSALTTAKRAQALEGIDAESRSTVQILLAQICYLLGDGEQAQWQVLQALKETQQRGIAYLSGRAQRLLGEIQTTRGLSEEADRAFAEALRISQQYGLRLDYARTLHRYGACLLQRASQSRPSALYQQGLEHLREARALFETCQADLDLRWVERVLAAHQLKSNV